MDYTAVKSLQYALILGTLLVAGASRAASAPRPVYVDPSGSDTEGCGTQARPFASVARAAAFIRSRGWTSAMTSDLYVYVNPGTYYGSALTLTDADTASGGFTIHYAGTGSPGSAVLDGGVLIPDSAWQLVSGSQYRILLSQWLPTGYAPWTIYENGVRAIAARTPNLTASGFYPMSHGGYLYTTGATFGPTATLEYIAGDVTPGSWDLSRTRLHVWDAGAPGPNTETDWFETTNTPTAVNTTTHVFTILNPDGGGTKMSTGYSGQAARWYASGDLSMLDVAGEFAVSGAYLYYISRTGGAPTTVTVPLTKTIVSVAGADPSHRVSHYAFDGLTVQDSDSASWTRFGQTLSWSGTTPVGATYDNYEHQVAVAQQGGFLLTNVDNVSITNSRISNIGETGVFLKDYAQNVTVSRSLIEHVGNGGIFGDGPNPGTGDTQNNNAYTDLYIRNFGEINGSGKGIELGQTSHNTVGPGEIWLGPNDAILLSSWINLSCSDMYSHDNLVTGWRIHDVDQDSGDRGAVTVQFQSRCGTSAGLANTIQNSTVNGDYADASMVDFPSGIWEPLCYFNDNQSDGTIMTNLLATNCRTTFAVNDAGTGPVMTNLSFLVNAVPNGSFNESLMPYASIGATAANPYAAAATYTYFQGFESGFADWTVDRGSPVISTTQAHDGTHSVKQTAAGDTWHFYPGQRVYGHFEIWLYDTGATVDAVCNANELARASASASTYLPATDTTGQYAALGIFPALSTTNYAGYVARSSATSSVVRSVGWHHLVWDASSGAALTMSVDGVTLTTVPGVRAISQVVCGDIQNRGNVGAAYWDGARFY
jgi:hypothetical protein